MKLTRLPLEGVRIATMTPVWAGPFAETLLADWGAEIIKVESQQYCPQGTRGPGPRHPKFIVDMVTGHWSAYLKEGYDEVNGRPWNRSCYFNPHGRNKLSCTMDVVRPKGREIFKRLIEVSDIFFESNQPHVMESLDLGYNVISQWNPGIIMLQMPSFGQTGPLKYYRTLGAHLDSYIGGNYVRGYIGRDVSSSSVVYHADETSGLTAAFIMLMALRQRKKTGNGVYIDMAQVETAIPHFGEIIMDYTMNGRLQGTWGNRDPYGAIQGCYRCLGDDRWVCITIGTDQEWESFCRVVGNPDWAQDEKFSDALSRWRHHDELDKHIEDWTRKHDHFAVMYMLQKEGVAAGPVEHPDDAYSDIQMKERGFFEEITHPECGTHLYPGLHYRMSNIPNHIRSAAPLLGEHNEYVYKQVIGVSDEEYAELEREGHIGMDFVPDLKQGQYKPE
jgi:crotonobetainyl-CoA:carnitine CoA-transferase CaiB-like acyl-CoA transferase